jgi:murein DD-endopeptidase MepM/ murein hydrolase activator NlpD
MRRLSAAFALGLLLLPTSLAVWSERPRLVRLSAPAPPPEPVIEGVVGRNTHLGAMLRERLPTGAVHALVEAARPVYDLARISAGQPFALTLGHDGLLKAFSYGIDELRTLRVVRRGEALEAELVTRSYETSVGSVRGVIASSLFEAVTASGEGDQLALDLAEIFAWDVDFHTELQRGDSFRVAVEKLTLDGRFCRYGRILSAEFTRGTRLLRAVWFEGSQASAGYYTPEGTPLRKAFLRSPLKFSRISSGFTRSRFHPILHTSRPHLGVDYAAPVGTAVRAAGDGVVVQAGWMGGYGKAVRIRHANGYETLYGHLSRFQVARGTRVAQGQVIGAVGRTGLATGPHLDYRMLRNGVFINPLKLQSPPAEPVPARERPAFELARDERLALLGAAGGAGATLAGDDH